MEEGVAQAIAWHTPTITGVDGQRLTLPAGRSAHGWWCYRGALETPGREETFPLRCAHRPGTGTALHPEVASMAVDSLRIVAVQQLFSG